MLNDNGYGGSIDMYTIISIVCITSYVVIDEIKNNKSIPV